METSVNTFWEFNICYTIFFKCHFQTESYYVFSFLLWQPLNKPSSIRSRFFDTIVKMNTYKVWHSTLRKAILYCVVIDDNGNIRLLWSIKNNKNGNRIWGKQGNRINQNVSSATISNFFPLWFFPATSREISHWTYYQNNQYIFWNTERFWKKPWIYFKGPFAGQALLQVI